MDLSPIYNQEILSLIHSLELQRAFDLKKFSFIIVAVLALNILFFLKFRSSFLLSLGLGFIIIAGSFYMINSDYKNKVQSKLLPKLFQAADPDFSYQEDQKVNIDLINDLRFFSHTIENQEDDGMIILDGEKKSSQLSFVKLESVKVDTEEGKHFTKRFEGVFIEVDFNTLFDQRYLIGTNGVSTPPFDAGDYLNPPHMGLKIVQALAPDFILYSPSGTAALPKDIVSKLLIFKKRLGKKIWVIFEKDRAYILVDGIKRAFKISIFHSLKGQEFIAQYLSLLNTVKKLVE